MNKQTSTESLPGPRGPCSISIYKGQGNDVYIHPGQLGSTLESAIQMMEEPGLVGVRCHLCYRLGFLPEASRLTPNPNLGASSDQLKPRLLYKRFDKSNFLGYPIDFHDHIRGHKVQDWFLGAFYKEDNNGRRWWSCKCTPSAEFNTIITENNLAKSLTVDFLPHFLHPNHASGREISTLLRREGEWDILDTFYTS